MIHQALGERNFHIFYQLLQSGDPQLLADLELTADPRSYFYLAQVSYCTTQCRAIIATAHGVELLQYIHNVLGVPSYVDKITSVLRNLGLCVCIAKCVVITDGPNFNSCSNTNKPRCGNVHVYTCTAMIVHYSIPHTLYIHACMYMYTCRHIQSTSKHAHVLSLHRVSVLRYPASMTTRIT